MLRKKNKKSNLTLYIISFFLGIIIIIVAGILAPFGVLLNSNIYVAGEKIMLKANSTIQQIQNETIKSEIQSTMNKGLAATENNISINNDVFQYGWVAFVVLFFILVFLGARQIKESSGGIA